jgi:branched-chain amino acid transport system ATP-binding protein
MTETGTLVEGAFDDAAPPLLHLKNVRAGYGAIEVLHGIDITVGRGQVVAMLGPNGAGKSTTLKVACGLVRPISGALLVAGHDVTGASANALARAGLCTIPEGRGIFPNLTVRENLDAFAENRSGAKAPWTAARVLELFPRLAERWDAMGNQLSGGEQQMLAIGRALMTNPRLLILDEATEGLAPRVREDIWRCLAALKDAGHTILVIDKYVDRLVKLADQHTILERGRVVWRGDSPALAADTSLWHRYLGV